MADKLTISVAQGAEELGVSTKTMYNLVHRQDFPTIRIGRRIRISREGLQEWVRQQEQSRGEVSV